MRRIVLTVTLVACLLAYTAEAVAKEKVTATPSVVHFGQPLTIKGSGWPVIEFCSRRVSLSLRSSQNAFALARVHIRVSGRFTFRWTPRRARVGAGRWRVVARMRCESGNDGSPVIVRATDRIRIAE